MSLGYCGSCGEPVEGRFCRMCGTAYSAVPASAVAATALQQTAGQQQLPTYPTPPAHRPTHAQPPESDFESLFRPPEGQVSAHSRTQLIPPVEADYRMPPPAASQGVAAFGSTPYGGAPTQLVHPQTGDGYPPGPGQNEAGDWDDDEPNGMRKPVVWAALGAVVAASAVILGLLYIGSHNNNSGNTGNNVAANTATAVVATTPTVGSVSLAPGSANPSPSASASPSASPSISPGGTTLPLSLGSTGQYVQYVQTRLRQLGFYHGSINDQYDQATAQAVVDFQAHAGVTGDPAATVGRSTLTALLAAGSQPNLHLGQRSGDVRRLQEALNSAESAGLNVSGKFDAATAIAVGRYQQQVGANPTGSANAQTWAALQSGHIV